MRKPRDLDAELEALTQRAKALKSRRVTQFGELVVATGADSLEPEVLVGALLAAASSPEAERSNWRDKGVAFFRREKGSAGGRRRGGASGDSQDTGSHAGGGASA